MRGLGGFVLLAGIGVGLFVYFPAPVDRDTSLEQAKRVVADRVAHARGAQDFDHRAQQRRPHLRASPASRPQLSSPLRRASRASPQRRSRAPLATATKIEPVPSWQTNVVPAADVGGPPASLDPTDPESRYKLVVDIQQQLKRVGCYWGRANGAWNNNTREAMHSFTANTNAALPVDKPDYLLLSLLEVAQRPLVRHARDDDRRGAGARQERSRRRCPAGSAAVEGGAGRARRNAPLHTAAEQRRLGRAAARPHGHRRPERSSAGSPGAAHPWWPHQEPPQVSRVSLPLRSIRAPPRPASVSPSAAAETAPGHKKSRRSVARERRATISC